MNLQKKLYKFCPVTLIIIQFRSSTLREIRVVLFDIVLTAKIKVTIKTMTNVFDNTNPLPVNPSRRTLLMHCIISWHTGQLLPVQ